MNIKSILGAVSIGKNMSGNFKPSFKGFTVPGHADKVEFLWPVMTKAQKPGGVDERAFYLNVAMNAVVKEGYELAAMTNDEVVMKSAVK